MLTKRVTNYQEKVNPEQIIVDRVIFNCKIEGNLAPASLHKGKNTQMGNTMGITHKSKSFAKFRYYGLGSVWPITAQLVLAQQVTSKNSD